MMFRRPAFVLPIVAALLLTAGVAPAPDVPAAIAVPPGHTLMFSLHATGVQIYVATAGKARIEWTLQGPLATLTDDAGAVAAYHYEGPTWESVDGSRSARDAAEPVKSSPAPGAGRDVPWLLIKVRSEASTMTSGRGRLAGAVYVERIDTTGGLAPSTLLVQAGAKVGVPYTATYRFFGKAN